MTPTARGRAALRALEVAFTVLVWAGVLTAAVLIGLRLPAPNAYSLAVLLVVVGAVLTARAIDRAHRYVPDESGDLIAPRTGAGRWPTELTQKGLPR